MSVMKEVNVTEYDRFKRWYLKHTNSRVLKSKHTPTSTIVLDKVTKETVCSESHRLGNSRYLIKQSYYDLYTQ